MRIDSAYRFKAQTLRNQLSSTLVTSAICFILLTGCATPSQQLSQAVYQGDAEAVVKILKTKDKTVNITTPVRVAAGRGHKEILRLLLDAGADINSGNETALMTSTRVGNLNAVRLLVEFGADINKQQEALVVTEQSGSTTSLATVTGAGNNALSLAILNKQPSILCYLIEHGGKTDTVVAYKNATIEALAGFAPNVQDAIVSSDSMTVNEGRPHFVRVQYGKVTTNSIVEREKKASIKELAETSGDNEVIKCINVKTSQ